VAQEQWTGVDRYITDLLVPHDAALDAVLEASATAGLPPHNVSPNQGKLLHLLALVQGARTILEIGTLGGYSTIWLARALDRLPQLAAEGRGPFDLIFIDADKPSNPDYFAWALRLSRRGSLIIADNVVRNGAVVNAASGDPSVQGVRRFHELLAAEARVRATAIQTVGSKGYDGFAIALVTTDR
jgi:predicted O-methyltransferase YrrM